MLFRYGKNQAQVKELLLTRSDSRRPRRVGGEVKGKAVDQGYLEGWLAGWLALAVVGG